MNLLRLSALVLAPLFAALSVHADDIRLDLKEKGVEFSAGSAGKFVLEPPQLYLSGGEVKEKGVADLAKGKLTVKYPSGAKVEYELKKDEILCSYSDLPSHATGLMFTIILPIKLKEGGQFAYGTEPLKNFPTEKGGQFVQTGRNPFTLADPSGDGFVVESVSHWSGLQDNRFFNWPAFAYTFLYDVKADPAASQFSIKIKPWKRP